MKKMTAFVLFLSFTLSLFAQSVNKGILPTQIGKATFSPKMKLGFVGETEDGLRVIALLTKKGAYRKKMGSLFSGGGEEVNITAIGEFYLDENLKVTKSDYTIMKPDGKEAMLGDFEVLNKSAVRANTEVIATKADCMDAYQIADKYPELRADYGSEEEATEFYGPAVYYDNRLSYKLFSGAIKTVDLNKNIKNKKPPKSEEPSTLKGAFKEMFKSTPTVTPYEKVSSEKDIEDTYKSRGKKDYWMAMSTYIADPVDGTIIAHQGHNYTKDAPRKRNTNFEQELVAFDAKGEVSGRIDLNFEKPMIYDDCVVFQQRGDYDNAHNVLGAGYLFKELTGPFTKKVNPDPDPLIRHFYRISDAGKEVYSFNFKVGSEREVVQQMIQNPEGDHFSMVSYDSKAKVFTWYQMGPEGPVGKKELNAQSPFYESFKACFLSGNRVFLEEVGESFDAAGNRNIQTLVSYIHTDPDTKNRTNRYLGFMNLIVSSKGELVQANFINRSQAANSLEYPSLELLKEENDISVWMYTDPVKIEGADRQVLRIISQNNKTLETKEMLKKEDQFVLDSEGIDFIQSKEKDLLYLIIGEKIVSVKI